MKLTLKKKFIRLQSIRGKGSCLEKQKCLRNKPPWQPWSVPCLDPVRSFFCTPHKIKSVWVAMHLLKSQEYPDKLKFVWHSYFIEKWLHQISSFLIYDWDHTLKVILVQRSGSLQNIKTGCSGGVWNMSGRRALVPGGLGDCCGGRGRHKGRWEEDKHRLGLCKDFIQIQLWPLPPVARIRNFILQISSYLLCPWPSALSWLKTLVL